MISTRGDIRAMETRPADVAEAQYEQWQHWPVNWSAVWVGALTAMAVTLVIGLVALAVGAHLLGPEQRLVDLHKMQLGALIFAVCGAFFGFAAGGWVAAKIAGILRAEPAMLHGAIAWLVAVPLLMALIGLGAGNFFGAWYSGLAGTPAGASSAVPFERPEPLGPTATEAERTRYRAELAEYRQKAHQWNEDTPKVTRNSALGAVTALLVALVGSVLGGWAACGEPMTFTHYRRRHLARSAGV